MNDNILKLKSRSKRYPIRAPLQYRIKGERAWHRGESTNMSESGILFEAETSLNPGTRSDIHMMLPHKLAGQRGTFVTFQATIVRCGNDGGVAARISSCGLRRHEDQVGRNLGFSAYLAAPGESSRLSVGYRSLPESGAGLPEPS